ncbi:hypothetical protein PG993_004081 [Apiospora rasikravindrae]|uniref:Ankyrin n=1 Tax=Apiospora rasikravindrae TaxID=990691 RepID=A0ABR1TBR4_9PEZI
MASDPSSPPDLPTSSGSTTIEPFHDTTDWKWERQKTRIWKLLFDEKVNQKALPKKMKAQFGFIAPEGKPSPVSGSDGIGVLADSWRSGTLQLLGISVRIAMATLHTSSDRYGGDDGSMPPRSEDGGGHGRSVYLWGDFRLAAGSSTSRPAVSERYFKSYHPINNFTKNFETAARELLNLAFYHISNKLDDPSDTYDEGRRDEFLLDLITRSGLVGLKHPMLAEPTIQSVLEEVWRAALRRCRSKIVAWALDLHINLRKISEHHPFYVVLSTMWQKVRCLCSSGDRCTHPDLVSHHDAKATIKELLAQGFSQDDMCCRLCRTPLEKAIRDDLLDIVKIFVEHGINTRGLEYLRELDFDRLLLQPSWETPLERQDLMLSYLQDVFAKAFSPPRNPFDALLSAEGLIKAAQDGGPALLNILRAKGADFNWKNSRGEHPLGAVIAQARCYKADRCKSLIALGASGDYGPIRGDGQGISPSALHIASLLNHTDAMKVLLQNGPDLHTSASFYVDGFCLYGLQHKIQGADLHHAKSPLAWSLWKGSYKCALLLLRAGAPVEGHELLLLMEHLRPTSASSFELVELAGALIDRGTELDLQTRSGETALDIAISKGSFRIANILVLAGAAKGSAIPMCTIEAIGTHGWLHHLEGLDIFKNETCEEADFNKILDDWCRLYRCDSVKSQNSRLHTLCDWLEWEDSKHLKVFSFVLERYPQAYSSHAFYNAVLFSPNPVWKEGPALPASIAYKLVSRRRPEFVVPQLELLALLKLVVKIFETNSAVLLNILENLLQQEPRLSRMYSDPWQNPLSIIFRQSVGRCMPDSNRATLASPIQNKLLDYGFRVNTAVGLVAIKSRCSINELQRLMDQGFDPRKRYRWSLTALQLAVINGDLAMVRFLLRHPVNVNGRPSWSHWPDSLEEWDKYTRVLQSVTSGRGKRDALQFAVESDNLECAQLLVSKGADVNGLPARLRGATALQLAAMQGYIHLVKWLISLKANILAKGAAVEGMTAIEGAAAFGRLDVVGLLFEHENMREGEGRRQCIRAVGYARDGGYQALSSFIEDHIQWSDEDEDLLTGEDLVMSVHSAYVAGEFIPSYYDKDPGDDDCKGCVGETESVDEGRDEPKCCARVHKDYRGSEEGEPEYSSQCASESEHMRPVDDSTDSQGQEVASESYRGENAPRMSGEHRTDTAAVAHDEKIDLFPETDILGGLDLGLLPDFEFEYEAPAATGQVMGEIPDNEEWIEEPDATALNPGWSYPNGVEDWMDMIEFNPESWPDFSNTHLD